MLISYILPICLLGAAIGLIYVAHKLSKLRKRLTELESELSRETDSHSADRRQWAERSAAFEREIARLSKWQSVADAEAKAEELLQSAQEILDKATTDAASLRFQSQQQIDALLAEARADAAESLRLAREVLDKATADAALQRQQSQRHADELLAEARGDAATLTTSTREHVKRLRDEAREILESASLQAKDIADAARKRAEEVAGSAYDAMKNASLFEQTVKAMKNIIEGYGDQYLVPERSLLDGLAEEFGHTEAGTELKKARERSKIMVRCGTAATCEYVEPTRRSTAISFVADAFNGKVDSILSRVRDDNAGTLKQEILDAFTLVNYNGKAFREARVTEEYLEARLAELKWAAITQQLKIDEREEQRRIKEQIREEEKARKEYERAMREAARDEELLRKAMDKALQKVQQATEAQKAQYEEQLQELAEKLRQAEERSQRALSMAQQTKRGHVYIISNVGSFGNDVYKIGLTRRLEPLDRVRELGDSSVPFAFDVHALIFAEDAPALEGQLHKHFLLTQMNKVNHRKEFFRVGLKHVREEVEKLGLTAKWTMTAQGKEYRETLAIEKAIRGDPALRDAWIDRQLELESVPEVFDDAEVVVG
jgi:hypothetical protein